MIFHFSIVQVLFVFCQLNFIVLFPFFIKYHMFVIIVFWLGCDRASGLFFRARFASFHTHASLLVFFLCFFVLFHSCCSHALVFEKTLLHEFPMSCSHTEWYLPLFARRNSPCFDRSFAYENLIMLLLQLLLLRLMLKSLGFFRKGLFNPRLG